MNSSTLVTGFNLTYIAFEEFVIFEAILDSSFKIFHNHMSSSGCPNTNTMPTLHCLFCGFDTFPYDRILGR